MNLFKNKIIDKNLNFKNIILFNEEKKNIIKIDKIKAHKDGIKHFAFSLFIFDENYNLLLQKRNANKIFPNLWTNTCCSHPLFEKSIEIEINTRLFQEFGFFIENFLIKKISYHEYEAICNKTNFIENEYDEIFIAKIKKSKYKYINYNKNEISDFKWKNIFDLKKEFSQKNKEDLMKIYTPWFLDIINLKFKEILENLDK